MHFGAFHSSINPFLAISLSIIQVGYFVTPSPLPGSLIAFQAANGDILLRIFIFFPAQRLPLVFSQSKMTEVPSGGIQILAFILKLLRLKSSSFVQAEKFIYSFDPKGFFSHGTHRYIASYLYSPDLPIFRFLIGRCLRNLAVI